MKKPNVLRIQLDSERDRQRGLRPLGDLLADAVAVIKTELPSDPGTWARHIASRAIRAVCEEIIASEGMPGPLKVKFVPARAEFAPPKSDEKALPADPFTGEIEYDGQMIAVRELGRYSEAGNENEPTQEDRFYEDRAGNFYLAQSLFRGQASAEVVRQVSERDAMRWHLDRFVLSERIYAAMMQSLVPDPAPAPEPFDPARPLQLELDFRPAAGSSAIHG